MGSVRSVGQQGVDVIGQHEVSTGSAQTLGSAGDAV
jgi:hypothetical protein